MDEEILCIDQIKIFLEYTKRSENKKKILICSSIFKMKKSYDPSSKYTDGIYRVLKSLDKFYKKLDIVYRVYYDDSISHSNKKWTNVLDEIKSRDYCELVKYDCPQFKDEKYHVGTFGTLVRFIPLFFGQKDWDMYICIDIDNTINKYIVKKLQSKKISFYFKTSPCGYLIPHAKIPGINLNFRMIASLIVSKRQFNKSLFCDFLYDIYTKGPLYKKFIEIIKKTQVDYFAKKYNINATEKHGMVYGIDEFFLNNILLKYIIKNKIKYAYSVFYDDYVKGLYEILLYNDNFKKISKEGKIFFTSLTKKVLQKDYNDKETLYDNFKKILKVLNNKRNKNNIKYLKSTQKELRKVFKNNTYKKYDIPEIITSCISANRPIERIIFYK